MPVENIRPPTVVGATMYQHEFPKKAGQPEDKSTTIDNLKTGGPLFGITTYRENFFPKTSPTVSFVHFGL